VISYSDEIRGARLPPFDERSHELSEALHDVSSAAGDTVHTFGRADYVVRFLVNHPDRTIPGPHAFLVVAKNDGVSIMTKVSDGDLRSTADFSWDEPWFEGLVEKFRVFRELLEE
jgi:hypothetical protein